MGTVGSAPLLLSLVYLNVRDEERVHVQSFHLERTEMLRLATACKTLEFSHWISTSALLSAFLRRSRMNLADFAGQRPCPLGWRFLAWAVRPTPRQNLVKGIACLWAMTSSRYLFALVKESFLMACAVSLVF